MKPRIRISEQLSARIAEQQGDAVVGHVVDAAINRAIDAEEAASRLALVTHRPRRSELFLQAYGRMMFVFYGGRFAGVGVDHHEAQSAADRSAVRSNGHVDTWIEPRRGRPLTMSWCEWFATRCRLGGVELAS